MRYKTMAKRRRGRPRKKTMKGFGTFKVEQANTGIRSQFHAFRLMFAHDIVRLNKEKAYYSRFIKRGGRNATFARRVVAGINKNLILARRQFTENERKIAEYKKQGRWR